jgi:hypothetical protein
MARLRNARETTQQIPNTNPISPRIMPEQAPEKAFVNSTKQPNEQKK